MLLFGSVSYLYLGVLVVDPDCRNAACGARDELFQIQIAFVS